MFIPDSDDEGFKAPTFTNDDEFVPETEPQDVATMDHDGVKISKQPAQSNGGMQNENYEAMDDFQLDLVRLVLPGYVQRPITNAPTMANHTTTELKKPAKQSEEEMPMDLAGYSQEEDYEAMDDAQLELVLLALPSFAQGLKTKKK